MDNTHGMSTIVQVVIRWILPLTLVFGLGIAFFGHLTPGGGFAGGVVIACAFVMATLAFGTKVRGPAAFMKRIASSLDATGALAFLAIGVLGYLAGHFLQRWIELGEEFTLGSAVFVVLMNLAILLKIGAGLFAGFVAIAAFRLVEHDPDEKENDA